MRKLLFIASITFFIVLAHGAIKAQTTDLLPCPNGNSDCPAGYFCTSNPDFECSIINGKKFCPNFPYIEPHCVLLSSDTNTEYAKIDLNKDGQVNIIDYAVFKSLFQTLDIAVDLNQDAQVNILDYSEFKNLFNQ